MFSSHLPNPFYAALTTANAPHAVRHGLALRYEPGIIPFAAVPEPSPQALLDLATLLTPGEEIYLTAGPDETIVAAHGLELVSILPGLQMRFAAPTPTQNDPEVMRLTSADIPDMLDLKARAFPGFFGPRAPELGAFFGIRDPQSNHLVAMGGERLTTHTDREISALCTDPDHTGKGHAAQILRAVLRHQAQLGANSILHVTAANKRAIALYQHLGFNHTGPVNFVKLRRLSIPV